MRSVVMYVKPHVCCGYLTMDGWIKALIYNPQSKLNRRKTTTCRTRIFHLTLFYSSNFAKTYRKFMIPIYKLTRGNLDTILIRLISTLKDIVSNGTLKCRDLRWQRPEKRNKPGVVATTAGCNRRTCGVAHFRGNSAIQSGENQTDGVSSETLILL